jgi:hypothetical protein
MIASLNGKLDSPCLQGRARASQRAAAPDTLSDVLCLDGMAAANIESVKALA